MGHGRSIPYYKREQIAREYHLSPTPMNDIRAKYNLGKEAMWKITMEFPPSHFMGIRDRPNRQFLMITSKLKELVNKGNDKAVEEVAMLLSKY